MFCKTISHNIPQPSQLGWLINRKRGKWPLRAINKRVHTFRQVRLFNQSHPVNDLVVSFVDNCRFCSFQTRRHNYQNTPPQLGMIRIFYLQITTKSAFTICQEFSFLGFKKLGWINQNQIRESGRAFQGFSAPTCPNFYCQIVSPIRWGI